VYADLFAAAASLLVFAKKGCVGTGVDVCGSVWW